MTDDPGSRFLFELRKQHLLWLQTPTRADLCRGRRTGYAGRISGRIPRSSRVAHRMAPSR
jgi:hypothetical protein